MKIAFFSPLPPKKTGIASYSDYLSAALSEVAEVHLFDTDVTNTTLTSKLPVIDFARNPQALTELDGYDGRVYQIGNNPWYHLDIYTTLLRKPGVVVLHDTVLYYLIAGLNLGGLTKEFCLNYGIDRLKEVRELVESCPDGDILRYRDPHRYPFLKRVFDQATAIIVHSDSAKRQVLDAGYPGPVHTIPHLYFEVEQRFDEEEMNQLRTGLGLADKEIVLGCFGFIGRSKRIESLINALELIKDRFDFKLLIVGEGDDNELQRHIKTKKLEGKVVRTGYVSDEDLTRYLALTDIIVNLRFPSMGETSGTLIRAFLSEKPCIVTNHGWFSEIPDSCVWKIGFDEQEKFELAEALTQLAHDEPMRQKLGVKAREYVEEHCSPAKVAREYLEVLRSVAASSDSNSITTSLPAHTKQAAVAANGGVNWGAEYLRSRISELLPPEPEEPSRFAFQKAKGR